MEGQGKVIRNGDNIYENTNVGGSRIRRRDEEHESRSGSDNMDGASSDDQNVDETRPPRKKRYHRHTPQQIQELEFRLDRNGFEGKVPANLHNLVNVVELNLAHNKLTGPLSDLTGMDSLNYVYVA
ncbi:hypothetical protein AgCh_012241 [Apium graveolens]